jgi:hypothetical protein
MEYIKKVCDGCGVPMHWLAPGVQYGKMETTCGLCKEPPDPAPTGPMPSHDEIVALAIANGFDNEDESGVGGDSSLDRSVCCGEYACGNEVIRFAHALLAKYGKG